MIELNENEPIKKPRKAIDDVENKPSRLVCD
jgi:hypothetical protein